MQLESFSVNNCISDAPRMLNNNFTAITDEIQKFYSNNTLKAEKLNINGTVTAGSITATGTIEANSGINVKYKEPATAPKLPSTGDIISIDALIYYIKDLEERIKILENKTNNQ